jgi:hypothetical protein
MKTELSEKLGKNRVVFVVCCMVGHAPKMVALECDVLLEFPIESQPGERLPCTLPLWLKHYELSQGPWI